MEDFDRLAESLREGSLIAVAGAGISVPYEDAKTGTAFPGIPGAGALVNKLASKRSYISNDMSFTEACFLYKKRDGRPELEQFLSTEIDRPAIQPLPAHRLLASLPFNCYITTNYDTLLERALRDNRKDVLTVIADTDVSRLRDKHTPVLKIHGCVTQPSTMIACADEFRIFSDHLPIVDALLRVSLAQKVVLFVGYSLGDHDFTRLITTVKRLLGKNMPMSYAVVQNADIFQKTYWSEFGVKIISEDLTDFLKGLSAHSAGIKIEGVQRTANDWRRNDFFSSLDRIHTLPSETQVIDAFLKHFHHELAAPRMDLSEVILRAEQATIVVADDRDAFEAFRQVTSNILSIIKNLTDKAEAEVLVSRVIEKRNLIGHAFGKLGSEIIKRNDSVLLYSQSKRVAEFLGGVPGGTQDTCQIFVSECRPRSKKPFQDGIAVIELLRAAGGRYGSIKLLPDAVIGNLMARNQITRVVMGAHAVYLRGERLCGLVNTTGSMMVIDIAKKYGVPVTIVAEEAKIKRLEKKEALPIVTQKQEGSIFGPIQAILSDLSIGGDVEGINTGYDLCVDLDDCTLVTDK